METWVLLAFVSVFLAIINNILISILLREGLRSQETIIYSLPFYIAFMFFIFSTHKEDFKPLTLRQYIILAVSTIFGGLTLFVYRSAVECSPNPGYVSAILSANMIPVTLYTILFGGAPFTLFKILGVAVVSMGGFMVGFG